ncbi:SDR family NAD(P)-dependent oxidoreductase, partial [Streptomyces vinaceus]|uniref:SDR family NAD(P)-dependent oxidoreductase n=1 Tax=Streptomyces vinaceus TaxID=1960 RepID=UPI0036A0E4E0
MRVVVTGGGRGIGRAVALGFAERGARVALMARTAAQVESVAAEIEALGAESLALPADVADEQQVERCAEEVDRAWGGGGGVGQRAPPGVGGPPHRGGGVAAPGP